MTLKKAAIATLAILLGVPVVLLSVVLLCAVIFNETNGAIVTQGQTRHYLLHVPARYDASKPVPLVVSLHPAMSWPAFQMNLTHWNRVADENGFLVVYPEGRGAGPRIWDPEGGRDPQHMPDVVFLSDLLDELERRYNIDPARIYVDGMSNGGGMAFVLSCTLADRIAAIGAVAAAQSLPWEWCQDRHPLPMLAIHGTTDPVVPYRGGKVWIAPDPFPSVVTWAANWAQRNRCNGDPLRTRRSADVAVSTYGNCADGASVVLYTISGGGHAWPGGKPLWFPFVGPQTDAIDATATLWAFFAAHPKHAPPSLSPASTG